MDVREKLVELLKSVLPNFRNNMAYWGEKPIYEFADCLLAHVVRCKDCKHWHKDTVFCGYMPCGEVPERVNWYADDFCSYGERKEDDE